MERYTETEFDHAQGSDTASISTGERSVINLLSRLAKRHPDECVLIAENTDGSVYYRIPWKWFTIRPPRKLNLTDEQRQTLGERLRKNINNKPDAI